MANKSTLEIEKTALGSWIWRFKAGNGKEISRASETYVNENGCIQSAEIGSPCEGVQEAWDNVQIEGIDEGTMWHRDENGELVEGVIRDINNYEDVHGRRLGFTPEARDIAGNAVLASPDLTWMLEAGFRMREGHVVLDDERWHIKHPDEDQCKIEGCDMIMQEPPV